MAIFNSYVSLPEGNQIMTQSYSWRITTLSKGPLSIYKWIIPMVKQPTKWDDPPGRLQGCPRGKKKHINSSRPTFTNLVGSPWWGFNMASPGFNPRSVGGTKGRTKNLDSRDQAAIIQSFWWQPVLMATKKPWICDGSETRLPHEAVPTRRSTHCPTSHRNSPRYPAVISNQTWQLKIPL